MEGSRIIQGECVEVMATLETASIDSVVTSPPYAMQRASTYGGISEPLYPEWTVEWMRQARRLLKPTGSVLINIREHVKGGQMSDYVHRTRMALRADGWLELDELIWDKRNGHPSGAVVRPRRTWERVLWFGLKSTKCWPKANGAPPRPRGASVKTVRAGNHSLHGRVSPGPVARCADIVRVSPGTISSGLKHPAAFPLPLAQWMVKLVTPEGGTVLDPFAGSGTTVLAAQSCGMTGIGIERLSEYAELASKRIAA